MVTAGLYAAGNERAAAIAVDGRLRSAAHVALTMEIPVIDPLVSALNRALDIAGLSRDDIQVATIVGDIDPGDIHRLGLPSGCTIADSTCSKARVSQFRGAAEVGVVLSLDDDAGAEAEVFRNQGAVVERGTVVSRFGRLMELAGRAAAALGVDTAHPIAAVEQVARARLGPRQWPSSSSVSNQRCVADLEQVAAAVEQRAASLIGDHLASGVRVERTPSSVARATLDLLCTVLAREVADAAVPQGSVVGFVGTAASVPEFALRLSRLLATLTVAPVPERVGATLGAALLPFEHVDALTDVAIGRQYSEQEIKDTLENCRLDYVYEPDWKRLLTRVSTLLASGTLVGWFQGPCDFGVRSFGSRSVLSDPSLRYSRENLNVYLLKRDLNAALPISGLDGNRESDVLRHIVPPRSSSRLFDLLDLHRERTGVPDLFNLALSTSGRLADTPREALATMFSSAVEVLVLGRFLVSKDYWLIRGH